MEISVAYKNGIKIVVVGDSGSGKSSLIHAVVSGTFTTNVAPVLSPSCLPNNMVSDRIPVTVVDTSTSIEQRNKLEEELRCADVVVLTYASNCPEAHDRLTTYWLPRLRQLEVLEP